MFPIAAMLRLGAKNLAVSKPIIESESDFKTYLRWESDEEITWSKFQQVNSIIERDVGLRKVRKERDRLLAECDWVVSTIDNGVANKDEWVAYRQALRDLPSQQFPIVWLDVGKLDMSQVPFPKAPAIIRKSTQ